MQGRGNLEEAVTGGGGARSRHREQEQEHVARTNHLQLRTESCRGLLEQRLRRVGDLHNEQRHAAAHGSVMHTVVQSVQLWHSQQA